MDRTRWQRVSAALDSVLDLDEPARAARLAELHAEDPVLSADVRRLLAQEDTQDHRIDTPLVTAPPGPREGERIGPYRLQALLGEGGMGQVWSADRADGLYERRVALKLLRPGLADPQLRLRFSREREILARLGHPHIARLLDAGISDSGQPYLALEFVEGEGLLAYAREHRLNTRERIALFRQVCDAVSHAHANLVVHRDLKPSNILVTANGDVQLLDFGIAKLLDDPQEHIEHTRTGLRPFTLHYAAPEQVRGEPVTTKTDVYSLGVILYELLTGQKPYRLKRESSAQWEDAILAAEPQRPSLVALLDEGRGGFANRRRAARELSGDLDNIVMKALSKTPIARYPSAEALSSDLQRWLDGLPVLARGKSWLYHSRKFVQRHRWSIAMGTGIAALLVGFLGVALWQRQEAIREAARAQALQAFTVGLFENRDATQPGKPVDVSTLVDAAELRGERELGMQPRAHAELLGTIARIRIALGQYPQAAKVLERQRALVAELPDAPSSLVLESATQRGRVQRLLGDATGCGRTLEPLTDTAALQRAQLPAHVAEFNSQLARCRRALGDREGAKRLFEQSLSLRRSALGDDIGVVENLTDLAALSVDAGDYPDALKRFEAALAQLRLIAGDRHPLSIDILRSIGTTQNAMGSVAAAGRSFGQALALSESLQGDAHPTTLKLRELVAQTASAQGLWKEAREQWLQVVEKSNPAAPESARAMTGVGESDYELGELNSAHQYLLRAARMAASARLTQDQLHALRIDARALAERGDYEAARRSILTGQHLLQNAQGGSAAAMANALGTGAGWVAMRANDFATAITILEPVVAQSGARPSEAQALLLGARSAITTDPVEQAALHAQLLVASEVAQKQAVDAVAVQTFRIQTAAAQCRIDTASGLATFDTLLPQLAALQPQGGALTRSAQHLQAACRKSAPVVPPSRARTQSGRSNGSGH